MKAHLKCGKDTLNDNLSLRASCWAEDSPSRTDSRHMAETTRVCLRDDSRDPATTLRNTDGPHPTTRALSVARNREYPQIQICTACSVITKVGLFWWGRDSPINHSLITLFLVKTKQNMSGSFHSRKLLMILGNN